MKVILNSRHGEFSLSLNAVRYMAKRGDPGALEELEDLTNLPEAYQNSLYRTVARDNPTLLQVFKVLGPEKTSGSFAALELEEIDESRPWYVEEDRGIERVVYFGDQHGIPLMRDSK